MKKKYIRPLLGIEQYTLTQAIAETCEYSRINEEFDGVQVKGHTNFDSADTCNFIVEDDYSGEGGDKYFANNCDFMYDDEVICYNGPMFSVFGSY